MITLTLLFLGSVLSLLMAFVMIILYGDLLTAFLYLFCSAWLAGMGAYGSRRRE